MEARGESKQYLIVAESLAKRRIADFTPSVFDRVFRERTPRLGLWLGTMSLSVAETVDEILATFPAPDIKQEGRAQARRR